MTVPEAAVDEDGLLQAGENEIRGSRQVSSMKAKAIAQRVSSPPNGEFWLAVLGADAAHEKPPLGRNRFEDITRHAASSNC